MTRHWVPPKDRGSLVSSYSVGMNWVSGRISLLITCKLSAPTDPASIAARFGVWVWSEGSG